MKNTFHTKTLLIQELTLNDNEFIYELVNTDGWIRYIGNRNISSPEAAREYISKILLNPQIQYWVVKLRSNHTSIGIITLIKRDYLESHDFGFAFLPQFSKRGLAYEAGNAVLIDIQKSRKFKTILATTIPFYACS